MRQQGEPDAGNGRNLWCMVGTTRRAVSSRPLAATLRAAWEDAHRQNPKLTMREVARRIKANHNLSMDHSLLSRILNGERPVEAELIAAFGAVIGLSQETIGTLVAEQTQQSGDRWVAQKHADRQMQMRALLGFESRASGGIIEVASMVIPGRLQIPEYTEAIMRVGDMPEWEQRERIEVRANRSAIHTRHRNPIPLTVYLGEEALHHQIGSPAVMADQLDELIAWMDSDRAHVDIRVIPRNAGYYYGLAEGGYVWIDFGGVEKPIVYVEQVTTGLFWYEQIALGSYQKGIEIVRALALSPADSRALIADNAHRYEMVESESVA